jgi:hypothetical protein
MEQTTYPAVYHAACNHLVAFGGHGGDTKKGRALVAAALRALRKAHGAEFAAAHRRSMVFITGQFPVK